MYFITTVFPQSEPFQVHILVYNRDSSSFIVSKQFSPDVLLANIKEPSNGMINTNVKVIQNCGYTEETWIRRGKRGIKVRCLV